jgi:hypothetical protein
VKSANAVVLVGFTLAVSALPAGADPITTISTIPGADITLPASIGTFNYSLPPDATIEHAFLFSPEFSFQAAPDLFLLVTALDGTPALSLPLRPADTSFFMGNDLTPIFTRFLGDGSLSISMACGGGPCPQAFTRVDGDWRLFIESTATPEPSTFLLILLGSVAVARKRIRTDSSPV